MEATGEKYQSPIQKKTSRKFDKLERNIAGVKLDDYERFAKERRVAR
jgi:hypothetical protein